MQERPLLAGRLEVPSEEGQAIFIRVERGLVWGARPCLHDWQALQDQFQTFGSPCRLMAIALKYSKNCVSRLWRLSLAINRQCVKQTSVRNEAMKQMGSLGLVFVLPCGCPTFASWQQQLKTTF